MVNLPRQTHKTRFPKNPPVQAVQSCNTQGLAFRSGEHFRRTDGSSGSSAPLKFRPHFAAAYPICAQLATTLLNPSKSSARSAMAGLAGGPPHTAKAGYETVNMY